MFDKNRNKTVGLCVMVVTASLVMAALWAVLAAPETALAHHRPGHGGGGGGGGDDDVAYDMVIRTENFEPVSEPLLTEIGDGNMSGSGPLPFFTRVTVRPTGSDYLIGVGTTGVVVQFKEHKGVLSLSVAGNDANRVWHVSDVVVPVDAPPLVAGNNMVIVVNADEIPIHRKNKSGPVIGTIAIGTIRLTAVQQP